MTNPEDLPDLIDHLDTESGGTLTPEELHQRVRDVVIHGAPIPRKPPNWFTRRHRDPLNPPYFAWVGELPFVCIMAHCLCAAVVVEFAAHWGGMWWPCGAVLTVAAWKEFWLDLQPWWEGDSYQDGVYDWLEYLLGCILGIILCCLRGPS